MVGNIWRFYFTECYHLFGDGMVLACRFMAGTQFGDIHSGKQYRTDVESDALLYHCTP